jgi:hypothetical protein
MSSKPREDSSYPAVSIRAPLLALPLNISISLVYFSTLGSSGWNIAINVSKGTVALLVKTGRRIQGPGQNSFLGELIEWVDTARYLGGDSWYTADLTDTNDCGRKDGS